MVATEVTEKGEFSATSIPSSPFISKFAIADYLMVRSSPYSRDGLKFPLVSAESRSWTYLANSPIPVLSLTEEVH